MDIEEAQKALGRLTWRQTCDGCGMENPPTVETNGWVHHLGCPRPEGSDPNSYEIWGVPAGVQMAGCVLPSEEQCRDALNTVIALTRTLQELPLARALQDLQSACLEPADQTVGCAICGQYWWDYDEDLDENWHAPGCEMHAARVVLGISKDIRRSTAAKYAAEPVPDPATEK